MSGRYFAPTSLWMPARKREAVARVQLAATMNANARGPS
jgi:hypothetical protein